MACQLRRAFTLVELLVVIGIIAVLISILLPSLSRARQAAQTVACAANLKQVGLAWISYQQDNNGWMIPSMRKLYGTAPNHGTYYDNSSDAYVDPWNPNNPNGINNFAHNYARWYNQIAVYTKNYDVLNCPVLNTSYCDWSSPGNRSYDGDHTRAYNMDRTVSSVWLPRGLAHGISSAGNPNPKWNCNYAYAFRTFGTSEQLRDPVYVNDWSRMKKWAGLVSINNSFRAYDYGFGFASKNPNSIIVAMDGTGAVDFDADPTRQSAQRPYAPYRWLHNRRADATYGMLNALCVDGHVELVPYGGILSSASTGPAYTAGDGGSQYSYIYYVK